MSALSSLRPKADPAMLEKVRQEEALHAQQQQASAEALMGVQTSTDASLRALPPGSQMAMNATAVTGFSGFSGSSGSADGGPVVTDVDPKSVKVEAFPFDGADAGAAKPPEVASYGGYGTFGGGFGGGAVPPPPPGAASGGLVPPPPAVSLSTQAQMAPFGQMPYDPYAANPYANPYAAPPQEPSRPALFGSGSASRSSADTSSDSVARKKAASFVPITPTGMEARSGYKQRDDLKVLWKGALARSPVGKLASREEKIAAQLARVDVGLPTDSSRGSLAVQQRTVDQIFKPVALDKHIQPQVKKLQSDLCQAYYRYLYTYNRFALAQQTVAARKQVIEVAATPAEQQRAAADLAQAQSEAESAREDMRAAQYELASVAGPQSARTIIGRVSGVSPSAESLAQGIESPASAPAPEKVASSGSGFLGGVGSIFGLGKKDEKDDDKGGKGAARDTKKAGAGKDLAPAPKQSTQAPAGDGDSEAAAAPGSPIAFELKNVNITPRKSILKVCIRNNGSGNFSFDPEVVSVSEGNRKLSEATVRAEFDTTLVQPNQEVSGTITIFGRPWNDRLAVFIQDGSRTIQMRR